MLYVICTNELLEKGGKAGKPGLIPVKVIIERGGKAFFQTMWLRPGQPLPPRAKLHSAPPEYLSAPPEYLSAPPETKRPRVMRREVEAAVDRLFSSTMDAGPLRAKMKLLDEDALRYIVNDATEASVAAEGMGDESKAKKYRLEAMYASAELERRRGSGPPELKATTTSETFYIAGYPFTYKAGDVVLFPEGVNEKMSGKIVEFVPGADVTKKVAVVKYGDHHIDTRFVGLSKLSTPKVGDRVQIVPMLVPLTGGQSLFGKITVIHPDGYTVEYVQVSETETEIKHLTHEVKLNFKEVKFIKEIVPEEVRPVVLTEAQKKALAFVEKETDLTMAVMKDIARARGIDIEKVEAWKVRLDQFLQNREIAVQRHLEDGSQSYENVLATGLIKNQFQTGTSRGSLGPYKGSSRDGWERTLFGGAFHESTEYEKLPEYGWARDRALPMPPSLAAERPNYGWVSTKYDHSVSSQYGKVSFVMKDDVKGRTTFFLGNSGMVEDRLNSPKTKSGTFKGCSRGLLLEVLNTYTLDPAKATDEQLERAMLDKHDYVELQVIGGIDIRRDVKEIRWWGTEPPLHLVRLAEKFGIPINKDWATKKTDAKIAEEKLKAEVIEELKAHGDWPPPEKPAMGGETKMHYKDLPEWARTAVRKSLSKGLDWSMIGAA